MIDLLKFLSMKDMVDGGGAGKAGPKFEGGGLLSEIANLLGKPLGWQDQEQAKGNPQAGGDIMSMPGFQPPSFIQPPQPHRSEPPVALPGQALPSPVSQQPLPPQGGFMPDAPAGPQNWGGYMPDPGVPEPVPTYSGRGHAGMPMPSYAQEDHQREAIEYLRSLGYRV
jgi:hypothetical protein